MPTLYWCSHQVLKATGAPDSTYQGLKKVQIQKMPDSCSVIEPDLKKKLHSQCLFCVIQLFGIEIESEVRAGIDSALSRFCFHFNLLSHSMPRFI